MHASLGKSGLGLSCSNYVYLLIMCIKFTAKLVSELEQTLAAEKHIWYMLYYSICTGQDVLDRSFPFFFFFLVVVWPSATAFFVANFIK